MRWGRAEKVPKGRPISSPARKCWVVFFDRSRGLVLGNSQGLRRGSARVPKGRPTSSPARKYWVVCRPFDRSRGPILSLVIHRDCAAEAQESRRDDPPVAQHGSAGWSIGIADSVNRPRRFQFVNSKIRQSHNPSISQSSIAHGPPRLSTMIARSGAGEQFAKDRCLG